MDRLHLDERVASALQNFTEAEATLSSKCNPSISHYKLL